MKRYQEQCRDEQRKEIASSLLQQQKAHSYDLEKHQQSLAPTRGYGAAPQGLKVVKAAKRADGARRRKSISMRLDSWRAVRLKEAKQR